MNAKAPTWEEIAHLWREVAESPLHQPEATLLYVLHWLEEMLDATHGFAVLARLAEDLGKDALGGWRVADSLRNGVPQTHEDFLDRSRESGFDDRRLDQERWARGAVRAAGELRVFMREDILGDDRWEDTRTYPLFEAFGLSDRIMGVLPVCDEVEVHIAVHRARGQSSFVREERDFLGRVLPGLRAPCHRWALLFGLIDTERPLSPRERETLRGLLSDMSEKQIAADLGLSPKSLHQYVVSIYRKFGVSSRPELMMKWLDVG